MLRSPGLAPSAAALFLVMTGVAGFSFALAMHLQAGLGASALRSGLTVARRCWASARRACGGGACRSACTACCRCWASSPRRSLFLSRVQLPVVNPAASGSALAVTFGAVAALTLGAALLVRTVRGARS